MFGERGLNLGHVVVFQHQGVLHHLGRHTGAGGVAKGGQAGAGFHQQRVGVAVVTAFELDDLLAAGGATRQAYGAHAGFGARADQAHHLDAGHEFDDFFGQFHLTFGGRAKAEAVQGGFLNGFEHGGVAVAQDHRAPGADVVDVLLPIGVPKMGALGALHKTRCAADGAKGAHRRVHTPGDELFGAFKELVVAVGHGHGGGKKVCSIQWRVVSRGKCSSSRRGPSLLSSGLSLLSSLSSWAQNKRSGTACPMPGWKPASRHWSR